MTYVGSEVTSSLIEEVRPCMDSSLIDAQSDPGHEELVSDIVSSFFLSSWKFVLEALPF